MAKKANGNWIKGAVRKPGALTKTAKQHGAIKKSNGIKVSWLKKAASGTGVSKTTQRRAALALKFRSFKKKGK